MTLKRNKGQIHRSLFSLPGEVIHNSPSLNRSNLKGQGHPIFGNSTNHKLLLTRERRPTWSKFTDNSHLCLWRFSGAVILRGSGLLHACVGQSGKGTVSMAPSWVGSNTLEYLWRWFPKISKRKQAAVLKSWRHELTNGFVEYLTQGFCAYRK